MKIHCVKLLLGRWIPDVNVLVIPRNKSPTFKCDQKGSESTYHLLCIVVPEDAINFLAIVALVLRPEPEPVVEPLLLLFLLFEFDL